MSVLAEHRALAERFDAAVRERLVRACTCLHCLEPYTRTQAKQRYCSTACRQRANDIRWYPRRKELEREYRARRAAA